MIRLTGSESLILPYISCHLQFVYDFGKHVYLDGLELEGSSWGYWWLLLP